MDASEGERALHEASLRGDEAEAQVAMIKAAESGHATGKALCKLHGLGGEARDAEQGKADLSASAAAGCAHAEYHLGVLAEDEGRMEEACRYYASAAQRGQIDAMVAAGMALLDGDAVPKDEQAGTLWLIRAAEAGRDDVREYIVATHERPDESESESESDDESDDDSDAVEEEEESEAFDPSEHNDPDNMAFLSRNAGLLQQAQSASLDAFVAHVRELEDEDEWSE